MSVRVQWARDVRFLAQRANVAMSPSLRVVEAVRGDEVLAQVGFDGDTPNAVCLHLALAHPAAGRHLLWPAFEYVFDPPPTGLGKGIALAGILSTNERSLALVKHLGFREVFRGRDYWGAGIDMVWHELRREECRFWQPRRRAA